jgi:Tfp pilus assembly protein PilX
MKILSKAQRGSVLITAMLTITILTLICATSLYVASQNANAGMQTASWQQALTGAESGVDRAIRALNADKTGGAGAWTGWSTQTYTAPMPTTQPPLGSPAPTPSAATTAPTPGRYNYWSSSALSPTISLSGISGATPEGNTAIWGWVTIDPATMGTDSNGNQWYRIRSTGVAGTNGLFRASSNKLDNDLRNTIALRFNRKSNTAIGNLGGSAPPQATRSIEVIMQPLTTSIWARGITLASAITMSGGAFVDSFDPRSVFKSTNGLWDITKRQNHGEIALHDSTGSDLKGMYVYGNLSYNGPAVKNTSNVAGTISTPGPGSPPAVSSPGWTSGYDNKGTFSGSDTINAGTKQNPHRYKYTSLTVPGGNTLTIVAPNSGTDNNYIEIWVTGKFTTSGSGVINQDPKVHTIIYVGDDITVSGTSFNNQSGLATNLNFIGYGPSGSKVTTSGSGNFIGTINAPNYDVTISGGGSFSGAIIANSLNISGSGGFHYDESLAVNGSSTIVGNYAFASWFEDNSDKARGFIY